MSQIRSVTVIVAVALVWSAPGQGLAAQEGDGGLDLRRPKVDLTAYEDATTTLSPLGLEATEKIGPGSALIITIPKEGRFGCTANFIWESGNSLYLGAAGHCFLPEDKKATHGPGADYDASGVEVHVCVDDCDLNFRAMLLLGTFVTLGEVAYARQTSATGDEQVGHDFGVVEIPLDLHDSVRRSMPMFGGPSVGDAEFEQGDLGCHYGHGVGVGETFLTKARTGIGGGSDKKFWMGDFAAAPGDSGSALVSCVPSGVGFEGREAVGVLTHLGLGVCPCRVKFKNLKVHAQHGVIFGTTVVRAIEMAKEAGLNLSVSLP